jgi:GntR family transcriptional regulator of arabinose operon
MPTALTDKTQALQRSAIRGNNRVFGVLRERIKSGHYQAGEWLPTERSLADDLNVDRRAVRTAVNQLVKDGLVSRLPHCRPVVCTVESDIDDISGPDSSDPGSADSLAPLLPSNFVALIMWHGGGHWESQTNTSQQRIFWGINQALAQHGYHTVFLDLGKVGNETDNAVREAAHLQYVMDRGFGGAIFYPYAYRSNHDLVKLLIKTMPVVMIDRRISPVETDFVSTANYQGMYDLTKHFVEKGHRRIACVTKFELVQPVQDRIQGYIDAIRNAMLDEMILTIPSLNNDTDWTVNDSVFRLPEGIRPTAAAVFNDYAACDLAGRLQNLGLRVPEDVAISGFDNIVSDLPGGPGLTTIAQPYEEIGKQAAELLLRRLTEPDAPYASILLPGTLIERGSSGGQR